MTVGAHPWVYAAKFLKYDITPKLDQIFTDMSNAEMAGVELMHHLSRSSESTERIRELKEKYDLQVIGTLYGADMWNREKYSQILDDAGTIISNLAIVGGHTLGTSFGNTDWIKSSDQLDT